MNTKTIRKMNTKGQVTLPAIWRDRIRTNTVVLEDKGNQLTISPAEIITGEEVLFDAVRDGGGKGIPVKDLIKALKKDLK
jgi:bifunctional DNA-binding transcriptional regulator/antitoxin component of YhaV-PrlF toxin-antitoxin module